LEGGPEISGDELWEEDEEERRDDDGGERERRMRVGEWTGASSSDEDESTTFSEDLYPFILKASSVFQLEKCSKNSSKFWEFPSKAIHQSQSRTCFHVMGSRPATMNYLTDSRSMVNDGAVHIATEN
jgi:hypothetical protein